MHFCFVLRTARVPVTVMRIRRKLSACTVPLAVRVSANCMNFVICMEFCEVLEFNEFIESYCNRRLPITIQACNVCSAGLTPGGILTKHEIVSVLEIVESTQVNQWR